VLAEFELAFGEWLAWLAYLQEYRDTLSPADSSFFDTASALDRATATNSAAAVTRRQLERCLGPDLPRSALRNVIRVASAVNLAALPIEETETSGGERALPAGPNLLSACVDVQITALEHAAAFARNRANLFKVSAQVVFWSGDPSTTIPLRYRLTGIATEVTSTGRFSLNRRPGELGSDELELTVDLDTTGTDTVLRTIFEQRHLSIPVRERLELHARRAGDNAFTDTPGSVAPGSTVTLRIRLAGDNIDAIPINLTHDGTGILPAATTTNSTGEALVTYTAPASPEIELVTATLTDNGAVTGDAIVITTRDPIVVTISPTSPGVEHGGEIQFTATVTGTSNTAVTWSATAGSITPGGLYTAPRSTTTATVTARSLEDPDSFATTQVTVSSASLLGSWTGFFTGFGFEEFKTLSFYVLADFAALPNPFGFAIPDGASDDIILAFDMCRMFPQLAYDTFSRLSFVATGHYRGQTSRFCAFPQSGTTEVTLTGANLHVRWVSNGVVVGEFRAVG
jgi:hypothetical protein